MEFDLKLFELEDFLKKHKQLKEEVDRLYQRAIEREKNDVLMRHEEEVASNCIRQLKNLHNIGIFDDVELQKHLNSAREVFARKGFYIAIPG